MLNNAASNLYVLLGLYCSPDIVKYAPPPVLACPSRTQLQKGPEVLQEAQAQPAPCICLLQTCIKKQ